MKYGNWFQKYPHLLEHAYRITALFFKLIHPLIKKIGYERVDSWLNRPERWAKEVVFGCKMCGQCILQSTGMTCSMNCPKNLRNGPCGGVRSNGHCEVIAEMSCTSHPVSGWKRMSVHEKCHYMEIKYLISSRR